MISSNLNKLDQQHAHGEMPVNHHRMRADTNERLDRRICRDTKKTQNSRDGLHRNLSLDFRRTSIVPLFTTCVFKQLPHKDRL
jgi:hypothetical protein